MQAYAGSKTSTYGSRYPAVYFRFTAQYKLYTGI